MPPLTKTLIDAARYYREAVEKDGKLHWPRVVLWEVPDGSREGRKAVPGLGLRVLPSGRKKFVLAYENSDHRKRLLTIGAYGAMTLDGAREEARKKLEAVRGGGDPVAEKRQDREERAIKPVYVRELGEKFIASGQGPGRARGKARRKVGPIAASTKRLYKSAWNHYIKPKLGSLRLEDVRPEHCLALHTEIAAAAPYMANRTMAAFSAAWEWGQLTGRVPKGAENPAAGCTEAETEKRGRRRGVALTPEELAALGEALAPETGPMADALRVYLLSGGRPDEVLGITWGQVHADGRRIKLAESKTGERTLCLGKLPAEIIARQAPAGKREPGAYVFASGHHRNKGGRFSDLQPLWRRLKTAAGLDETVRLYDAGRHSFTSRAYDYPDPADSEKRKSLPEFMVRKLTGHSEADIGAHAHYRHLNPSRLLEAADEVSRSLAKDLGLLAEERELAGVAV